MEIYGMTGERLGTIGTKDTTTTMKQRHQPQAYETDELPQWKKNFLSKPSISIRRGISWNYRPSTEPTSTIVLTSFSGRFVDIRFPVQHEASQTMSKDPHYWAFSGTSSLTFDPDSEGCCPMPYSAHGVWGRDLDSKGSGITDEGDMFLLPNGDCMEVGTMENPETGAKEMYKEYWTGPPAASGGKTGVKKLPCIVAEVIATDDGIRAEGYIVRVGDYCQGVARAREGNDIIAERWTQISTTPNPSSSGKSPSQGMTWVKDKRSTVDAALRTESVLPCRWVCSEERSLGDEVTVNELRWKITELTR